MTPEQREWCAKKVVEWRSRYHNKSISEQRIALIEAIPNWTWDRDFLQFDVARFYVHSLRLKGQKDWQSYCKSRKKPNNIPANPSACYKEWVSWGDWLGKEQFQFLPFEEARAFVRSLGLATQKDWHEYSRNSGMPHNIPRAPQVVYKNKWRGCGDWIGTGRLRTVRPIEGFLSFTDARTFVHSLRLKGQKDWQSYCSKDRPANIPAEPKRVYKTEWLNLADWLGYVCKSNRGGFLRFEEAREVVHTLGVKTQKDWSAYAKSGDRPINIPATPQQVYNREWVSWGDWLGTGFVCLRLRGFLPFEEARSIVHSLRLTSRAQWFEYCKSGSRPSNIPTNPRVKYKDEWKGERDWLGL